MKKQYGRLYYVCWKSRDTGNTGHCVVLYTIEDAVEIVVARNSDPDRRFDFWFEPAQNVLSGVHPEEFDRQQIVFAKYAV